MVITATNNMPHINFATPQLYKRTIPISCSIRGNIIESGQHNWAKLLIAITEMFIKQKNEHIVDLYSKSLPGCHSPGAYFQKDKGYFLSALQLSNGYYINAKGYNIPLIIITIRQLCIYCEINLTDVFITYTPKEDSPLPQSSHLPEDNSHSRLPTLAQHDKAKIVCETISRNYPNGFVFSATALRLLSGKVGFAVDAQLQAELQQRMFSCSNGIWFFPGAFADNEVQQQLLVKSAQWLSKWQFFSLSALYDNVRYLLSDRCSDIKEFELFWTHLAQTVPELSNVRTVSRWGMFRIVRAKGISCDKAFSKIASEQIKLTIDNAGGVVSESDLLQTYPLLDCGLLAAIIKEYMPWVIKTDIGGVGCFQNEYHLDLPADFTDRLSTVITRLAKTGLPVSDDNLHTALSFEFGVNFCKEYNIPDKKVFRRFIGHQYIDKPKRIWSGGVFAEVSD